MRQRNRRKESGQERQQSRVRMRFGRNGQKEVIIGRYRHE